MKKDPIRRVIVELGMKPYTSYDDETVERVSYRAFKYWEHIIHSAPQTDVLLWVGDGDEVFNWRGNLGDEIDYNKAVGFCNRQYRAYPDSKHVRTYGPDDYIENPPTLTYTDLKRVIQCLRRKARELFDREIQVGTIIDAGPEFVESEFKFERHPEIVEGGPDTRLPQSCKFINCYAAMNGDGYPYAEFPNGVPEGTKFGEFLGRQLQSMCDAVGFDYCWFSNGLGFTHYAWSYLGEVFDGREWDLEAAPKVMDQFAAFWREFRRHCPEMPIEVRGTNFMIGSDAAAHGIDVRRVYEDGKVELPAPNPPWGSAHLDVEMASHMSRISWTPTDRILFRFYMNDSWFLSRPWWDYYHREPYDIYCPMAISRVEPDGSVSVPTDLALMTVNSGTGGMGHLEETQGVEITPHFQRAFEYSPDAPGPIVWVYPFNEYQDLAAEGGEDLPHVFFHDWFVARCINAGVPLNTVIHTGAFVDLLGSRPEALCQSLLFAPAGVADSEYVGPLLDFVRGGGTALLYGSLANAPESVREALGLALAEPLAGDLQVETELGQDAFVQPPGQRVLVHRPNVSGGGIRETAEPDDAGVLVKVKQGSEERAYAVLRSDSSWSGGQLAWIRGSLPFEATPLSREPVYDDPRRRYDAGRWVPQILSRLGITVRQTRYDVTTPAVNAFIYRHEGAFVFTGKKANAWGEAAFRMPDGAPVFEGMETLVRDGTAEYRLSKTFHHMCRVFVEQPEDGMVRHEELRVRRGEHRHFRVLGLRDARITVYPEPDFVREGGLSMKSVSVYSITDPSAVHDKNDADADDTVPHDVSRPGRSTVDLPEEAVEYTVDHKRGAVVAENVNGNLEVLW